jgi:hypothetical protein
MMATILSIKNETTCTFVLFQKWPNNEECLGGIGGHSFLQVLGTGGSFELRSFNASNQTYSTRFSFDASLTNVQVWMIVDHKGQFSLESLPLDASMF